MKIEIKLADNRYCDGCPCLNIDAGGCYGVHICQYMDVDMIQKDDKFIRPQKCIEKNQN